MATNKHVFVIKINGGSASFPLSYQFGRVQNINLSADKQKITITYDRGGSKGKSFDEMIYDMITFKDMFFRDALRKSILVHILRFSENLNIDKLSISIDGEEKVLTKDNDPTGGFFPYMFSLVGDNSFTLGSAWKSLDEKVCVISKTKSEDEDLVKEAFSAMYSYLAGKGRVFEVDRFSNLWTAMNSYYRFIAGIFEASFIEQNRLKSVPRDVLTKGNEKNSLGILENIINERYYFTNPKNIHKKTSEEDKYKITRLLSNVKEEDLEKVYIQARNRLKNPRVAFEFTDIEKWAEEQGTSVYAYFLIRYAYKLRCNLLHGNSHTLFISAYNSYEIHSLRIVNYFLDKFLEEKIPEMFDFDKWASPGARKNIYMAGCKYWENYLGQKNHNYKNKKQELINVINKQKSMERSH